MFASLRGDLRAVRERDPAARSAIEVALAYPGVHAIWGHRVARLLWRSDLKLAARVLASLTRVITGVEIHPAATLGEGLFIDHATGVVIGETAEEPRARQAPPDRRRPGDHRCGCQGARTHHHW